MPERPTDRDQMYQQAVAANISTGLNYWWHQAFKQGDPLGHGKKDIIKWGKVVLKKVIVADALDTKGILIGAKKFPWRLYQIAPMNVFEVGDPSDPDCVYEAYLTTVAAAKQLFPEVSGTWKELLPETEARVVEYWEKPMGSHKGVRRIWINGERVLNKVNPYHWVCGLTDAGANIYDGYVPYFIADSGWGDGALGTRPEKRYVGMIRRLHSMLETEARQLTSADAQLRISTFPVAVFKGFDPDDEHPVQFGPGARIDVQDEQEISLLAWPQLDPSVFNIIRSVHTYMNELAQFQTLAGIPQSGVDTATEADQNYRAASSKLDGPIRGLRSVITRVNETILMDIEHIFEAPVTLYGAMDGMPGTITIKPEWIDGFYENFVELKTSDAKALDAANAVRWGNLKQIFGLDARYAMKMAGIANPMQRIAQKMQEDVWFDPRSHEIRFAEYVANFGEFGQQMSGRVLDQALNGVPTDKPQPIPSPEETAMQQAGGGGGGFAPPPFGEPNARGENPGAQQMNPAAAPPQQNATRARATNEAAMRRPDQAYSG